MYYKYNNRLYLKWASLKLMILCRQENHLHKPERHTSHKKLRIHSNFDGLNDLLKRLNL